MSEYLPGALHFNTKDNMLDDVELRLPSLPEKKAELKGLFSRRLVDYKEEIIGVRYEDIGTFLYHYLNGAFPPDEPNNGRFPIIASKPDWYYVAIVWGHPLWEEFGTAPYFELPDFKTEVSRREIGFSNIAFKTTFASNVTPILKTNWLKKGDTCLQNLE